MPKKPPLQFSLSPIISYRLPRMGNQYCKQQASSEPLLTHPWRDSPPFDSEQLSILKTRIESYSPPSYLDIKQARILMLGPVGAGKSSYFNTINSIFQDRITQQGMVGSSTFSLTKMYRQYQVRSQTTGSPLNFRLCDTCGIQVDRRPDLADLNYLLEGNVPDGYTFNTKAINPDIPGFISEPLLQDKVHCVVYVFAASSIKTIDKDTWVKLNGLQSRMNDRAIPRLIILTKIDDLSETLMSDVSTVYLNKDVQNAVQCVSEKLRFPPGNVYPIKNYESEIRLNNSTSCLALQALDRMLGYANDFLTNQHDLKQLT